MKINNLVYVPTGLNSPEVEILSSTIQDLLDKNQNVTVLLCSGAKNFSCSKNLFSFKVICNLCKFRVKKNLSKIKGNYKIIKLPNYLNNYNNNNKLSASRLKKYHYKTFDNGLASYSSYLTNSRDKDLDGYFADRIIRNNLNTTNTITNYFLKILKNKQYNNVYSYNSRMNLYRPLLRTCQKFKIKFNNLESVFDDPKLRIQNLKSTIVNDYDKMPKLINWYWRQKSKVNRYKIINKYYNDTKNFRKALENPSSFVGQQQYGLLPKFWNYKKYNIVYYVSSEDEYETVIKKNYRPLFKNQISSILEICKIIQNKFDYHLWIRVHPNLSKVNWNYSKYFQKSNFNFENVSLINSNSSVSTYALMEKADLIIGLRSRTLLESTFIKKPSIILGKSYWGSLGPFIIPKSINELKKLILSKKMKHLNNIGAKKYAFFWGSYGYYSKYISGRYNWKTDKSGVEILFYFKKSLVKFSKIQNIKYLLFKTIDKFILLLNQKLS
jgi:hypothetical protein